MAIYCDTHNCKRAIYATVSKVEQLVFCRIGEPKKVDHIRIINLKYYCRQCAVKARQQAKSAV